MASPANSTNFGRYRLIRKLASGGMAEVYLAELATAAGITKQLVIKKILKYYADDAEFREMFIGEARIAVGLSHGNIAQVFDFGEVDGEYFLALEYVAGRSVANLFKRAAAQQVQVPVEYAAVIAMEMCKGLHYAHTRVDAERRPLHLVHRDISPQNVLVSYEGQVKLVDFGIAKAYGTEAVEGSNNTETGVVKGKYLYFSPEQASALRLDGLTDVYATGVVLYEMVCGRRPFEGQQYAVLSRLLSGDFPPPRTLRPALPEALAGIVVRAMATKKEDRFGSALEMQESLAGFLAEYAPRLTQASITNLMRWLFRADLESAGEDAEVPASFAAQVRDWGQTERQGAPAHAATRPDRAAQSSQGYPATVTPGAATLPTPQRPPWLALGIGVSALAVAGIGAVVAFGGGSGPRQMEAVNLVVPMHSTASTPAPAAPPTAPPSKGPLPDQLAGMPSLPGAKFGGRLVPGMRCEEGPKRSEVKGLEAQATSAAVDSHFNEATSLLNEAIGGEPTAGALYLALVDDSAATLDPAHLDLTLRDVETFRAACPSTRRPVIDTAYDRLSGLASPDPTPSPTKALAEADRDVRHQAARLRADAESLMHRQRFDQALAKLQSAIELTPGDPKLLRLQQVCLESSGGELAGRPPSDGYRTPGSSKGRH